MKFPHRVIALLATGLLAAPALAAEWGPTKPVRFIVGFPPGGATDLVARILQPKLAASLGNQVIVDNRPGANGVISMQILSRAEPDGHSVGMSHIGSLVVSPAIQKTGYDPMKDFVHLGMLVTLQNILITHPSVPAKNIGEFIAYAKSQPGKVNYATSGIGSPGHLAVALLEGMAGITLNHVPYKGGGPAITDLIAGHVPAFMAVISTAVPHVQSGKARALGVTGAKRAEALPGVPTIAEAGVKGYQAINWYGLSAPPKTPSAISARLNRDFAAALAAPDVIKQLKDRGIDASPSSGSDYQKFIRSEQDRWIPVIKHAKIEAS
ncbi:MAG: tripartite tricarboxylate transporter substrate binding protein [Burkholderiales bacterium]|nr:tripartite tricarboxylate transporter substrate binding protein [Burkholderiales bacterium]MDP2397596.1 tripartite tricarboxylate transporter substrate binding protein [Burkholderiales bacterium]